MKVLKAALVGVLDVEVEKERGEAFATDPSDESESEFGFSDPAFPSLEEDDDD